MRLYLLLLFLRRILRLVGSDDDDGRDDGHMQQR